MWDVGVVGFAGGGGVVDGCGCMCVDVVWVGLWGGWRVAGGQSAILIYRNGAMGYIPHDNIHEINT